MEKRLKALEVEIAYLRKAIEELNEQRPIEVHNHYHYDYSNMKPMVINDMKGMNKYLDEMQP